MCALFPTNMLVRMLAVGSAVWLTGCAEVQMGYNVLTYDSTVADTANQQVLLNAVRASQRLPKSFTTVGQVQASPPVGGSLASAFNLASLTGLTTYSFTPNVSAGAGYTQFTLQNANSADVLDRLRKEIDTKIIESFRKRTNWPRELLDLTYVQGFDPSLAQVRSIDAERRRFCAYARRKREIDRCGALDAKIDEYSRQCTSHFTNPVARQRDFYEDSGMYYNTAVNYCHFTRFQIFLREVELLNKKQLKACSKVDFTCVPTKFRSAFQLIDFLGELIAAQNYVDPPFIPVTLYGYSTEREGPKFIEVPLFVVHRGAGIEKAAVSVQHDGVTYYIPQPDFGSPYEARSLQLLDLVLQTVRAATLQTQNDVPKVPTIGIIKQ